MAEPSEQFDPRAIIAALERNYVDYVIIGGLARVLRGSDELTRGVDICPALTPNNDERLVEAGLELDSRHGGRRRRTLEQIALAGEDLARMTAALRREQDIERLRELRRIMELEVEREPVAPLKVQSPSEVTRGPREWARLRERDRERGMER